MAQTFIQQLAAFSADTAFDSLPPEVTQECKRLLLDSIGCAAAAVDQPKGRAGIEYARIVGAGSPQATVIGTGEKVSLQGAAFANAELINTLDMDAILPPGHVSPYVIPGALASAEALGASGKEVIVALAVSHEMSNRFGKAMDNQRRVKDGRIDPPKIFGYASSIFGATAAIGRVRRHSRQTLADALGIAASISPVNPQMAWFQHVPISTIKYLAAGMLAQQAMTAALMAELGHNGDLQILDDREYGYARFIGTEKWEPAALTDALGSAWHFPAVTSYKPYAHCRVMHGMFDCIVQAVREHKLQPGEIESMKVYVEGITQRPAWLNREIQRVEEAQFSMAHGIAMAAHDFPHGKAWQDPKNVFSPSVLGLMARVTTEVHPDYARSLSSDAASRPSKVEIRARGQTFVQETRYPKGTPSPEADSLMTDAELADKFRRNCEGVLSASQVEALVDKVWNLEGEADFGAVMRLAAGTASTTSAASPTEAVLNK